ncbi:YwaF family protein [Thalassobacillus sp. B23F22_16]|uniref:YwaF family protein n=1 Tax=Thalassobacillus sp. B23F22_16 TaxID=3459513 RepID=UPI00373E84EE
MNQWFSSYMDHPFSMFGVSHIAMLMIYSAGLALIVFTHKPLQKQQTNYQIVRWVLFALLIVSEFSYQTWAAVHGLWNMKEYLPLHLCGIASLVAAAALVTQHHYLIKVTYFIAVIPALMALVTPDLPHDYLHYRFWKFFFHHMAISWAGVLLILVHPVTITWKTTIKVFGLLVLYAIAMGFVNQALGANYLYLSRTPYVETPLDWLGSGFWYYINLGLLAFGSFWLLYFIYRIFSKRV